MKKAICGFIFYKLMGWKTEVSAPDYDKFIMCAAPHTTNWDLIVGKLFMGAVGRETGFMMKKDWFFWPLGPIFRWMGGIPVNRGRKTSLVDQMIQRAKESKTFHLAITPEGTRKANPNWKKGFYHIAMGANLPILLVAIDYQKKCVTCNKVVIPTGDIEKDMREIKLYYKDFKGKHPENFSIGKVE
ncbi:MAG: lysophospholipid acyltransferase family protein [Phocaeicola sp.]